MTIIQLRKPRITKEQKRAVITDYEKGLQIDMITKKHDVSLATVYRIIRQK